MKRLALPVLLLLALLSGCGSSSSSSSTTSSTAKKNAAPHGRLGASVAPPKLGYYAGVECDSHCSYYDRAREGFLSFCHGGHPNSHSSGDYQGHNYVCFRLNAPNQLVDFYFTELKIVRSVHVSGDRFPETCDNGWCISGEWFSTRSMNGQIRNQNGLRAGYRAEWVSS